MILNISEGLKPLRGFPQHVAIIMDGNGRWAKARGLPRVMGHKRGVEVARQIVLKAKELKIKYLTLFTFSKENWQRPPSEIQVLFQLLFDYLQVELPTLQREGIRLRVMGDKEDFPAELQEILNLTEEKTKDNKDLQLILALSYGGRNEILRVAKICSEKVRQGELNLEDLNESIVRSFLYLPDVPDPDLLIRTGGELRISNFFLYQLAYTELYFTSTLWPDFTGEDLQRALTEFERRERRFGKVNDF